MMRFVAHTDVIRVKEFFQGLYVGQMQHAAGGPAAAAAPAAGCGLMIIFPYSKLCICPGLFFSPTRNQVDNPREKRHVADWARRLEQSEPVDASPNRQSAHAGRLARPGHRARWATCSASIARCRSTSIPASSAVPVPTSATTILAPRTRRTCRWGGRTCCARSTAVTSRLPASISRSWSVQRTSPKEVLDDWYSYFHQCSQCRRCSVFCPYGIDTAEISMAAREIMDRIGVGQKYCNEIIGKVYKIGNNLGLPGDGTGRHARGPRRGRV
jgi:Fe-S oxidoreductase